MQGSLPHHKLHAYSKACELLALVREAKIRDAYLRDHAVRAAKAACLNTAEGAARVSVRDKARAFAIARAEVGEACACVEIAVLSDDARAEMAARVTAVGAHLVAMLSRLMR